MQAFELLFTSWWTAEHDEQINMMNRWIWWRQRLPGSFISIDCIPSVADNRTTVGQLHQVFWTTLSTNKLTYLMCVLLQVCSYSWWFLMITDGSWWFLMGSWWVPDGSWWTWWTNEHHEHMNMKNRWTEENDEHDEHMNIMNIWTWWTDEHDEQLNMMNR